MLWMKNELVKMVENAIINGSSLYAHIATSETRDMVQDFDRNVKAMNHLSTQMGNQVSAFWSFWFPTR